MRHRGRRRSQPEGAAQLLRSMVGQLLHATGLALARLRYRIIRVIIPLQPSNRCLRFRLQVRLQQSDWGGGQKNQSKLKLAWRFAIRGTNGELGDDIRIRLEPGLILSLGMLRSKRARLRTLDVPLATRNRALDYLANLDTS